MEDRGDITKRSVLDRIKNIKSIKLLPGTLLLRLRSVSSFDIVGLEDDASYYGEVILKHGVIEDIDIGDIVLDFSSNCSFIYRGERYAITNRSSCKLVLPLDKFNFDIDF